MYCLVQLDLYLWKLEDMSPIRGWVVLHVYYGLGNKTIIGDKARILKGCTISVILLLFSSVQFSHSVMSDSLQPHELQHARPPCSSATPGVHSNSRPLSWWCHPAISSSVGPFSCPQSLQASQSFLMSQLFARSGQSTGVSALASFLPKKSQGWSSERTGWISLQSKGLLRVFSNTIKTRQE